MSISLASSVLLLLLSTQLLFSISMAEISDLTSSNETFIQCLHRHSQPSPPISDVIYSPDNSSYTSVLQSYIRNLRFASPKTLKPLFIVTPSHESHIQATIVCSKIHGFQVRIRSGGHDYDGLSYTSEVPFVIIDMSDLRSVTVDIDGENACAVVQSGATLGELYYKIAEKSKVYGFPGGVCPTVGVGGHFSGAGYGNMMRKYGLTVDHVVDARIIDVNGRILDRESMGEDLFWAIRGGGGASFGVIVSWTIKLVPVPEIVTVFRVEKTLEQGATDIVHRWQYIADKVHENLFIRVVLMPSIKKDLQTIKAKFNALFLGKAEELLAIMNNKETENVSFPEFGLKPEDCIEMSWIESLLFWSNYAIGTPIDVLLERKPNSEKLPTEKFLKKKSDYVQEPISKAGLEGLWRTMIEMKKPALTLNPYGGRMSEVPQSETPFPHRAGNMYKIQYSITWKEDGDEADERNLNLIRRVYDYMTPYVSKSPRGAYLNYRDVDLGTNQNEGGGDGTCTWGSQYFMGNLDRLVYVKTMVDPEDFFRYEQSIPSLIESWKKRDMVE